MSQPYQQHSDMYVWNIVLNTAALVSLQRVLMGKLALGATFLFGKMGTQKMSSRFEVDSHCESATIGFLDHTWDLVQIWTI